MSKRILIFLPTASIIIGGGEIAPLSQANAFSRSTELNFEVTILTLKSKNPTSYYLEYKKNNPQIKFIELISPIFGEDYSNFKNTHENVHLLYLSLYDQTSNIYDLYDCCLIHYAPGIYCVPNIKNKILFLHGTPSEYSTYNDLALSFATNVIAVSNSIKVEWQEKLIKISKSKAISVINNGIDLYPYQTIERDKNQIFYIGRLIEIKGLEFLIKSVKLLVSKYPDMKLLIAGKGSDEYTDKLINLVKELGLNENINFLGAISEEDKYKFYRQSSLSIFPSYAKEGVLTTMLEATTQYCPVITTNSCGMVDFLINEEYGLLAIPKDEKSLAEKIDKFLSDQTLREKCANNAFNRAKNDFSWEENIKKLTKIIDENK